jgi:signal transduction histidine kinase
METATMTTNAPALNNQELAAILQAWQEATQRLEQTHETLRAEVRRLTDELEAKNRELARKNRLADLGQMAAHIAHEVRNTLVPVSLYLSLLQRKLASDRSSREVLDKIRRSFTALEVTVSDLLHFTADREPAQSDLEPLAVVQEVLDSLQPQIHAQHVQVSCDIAAQDKLVADQELMRRALMNLVLNALDVLPKGGQIHITGVMTSQGYELEVADNGPGWSEAALQRATEPFFTTKNHGTGLGLAIVERIMDVHHGQLWLQNCPQGGAAVTLAFHPAIHVEHEDAEPLIAKFPQLHHESIPVRQERFAA